MQINEQWTNKNIFSKLTKNERFKIVIDRSHCVFLEGGGT